LQGGPGGAMADMAALGQIKGEGDKATVTDPNDPKREPILLVKKGGKWLVDVSSDAPKGADRVKTAAAFREFNKTIADLRTKVGKEGVTADKVAEELMGAVMKMATAAGGPTPPGPGPGPGPEANAAPPTERRTAPPPDGLLGPAPERRTSPPPTGVPTSPPPEGMPTPAPERRSSPPPTGIPAPPTERRTSPPPTGVPAAPPAERPTAPPPT